MIIARVCVIVPLVVARFLTFDVKKEATKPRPVPAVEPTIVTPPVVVPPVVTPVNDTTTTTPSLTSSAVCGNNLIESNEECDGTSLVGKTCADLMGSGYTGIVRCRADCTFDLVNCVPQRRFQVTNAPVGSVSTPPQIPSPKAVKTSNTVRLSDSVRFL